MLLKELLVGELVQHHKIKSINNIGKIVSCEFICFDSEVFGKNIHLICKIEYQDKNNKTRNIKIEENVEYLEFCS